MKLSRYFSFLCVFFSGLSASVLAQEAKLPCDEIEEDIVHATPKDEVKLISEIKPAETLKRVNPKYPIEAAKAGSEGWVRMSYVIDTEGAVKDVIVEDFEGSLALNRAAVRAIKQWEFSPALKDGKPTEICHNSVQMDFVIEGNTGARRNFVRSYKKIDSLIKEDKLDEARAKLTQLSRKKDFNRYENAWFWNLELNLATLTDDVSRQKSSLKRILSSVKSHSSKYKTFSEEYVISLRAKLFVLEVNDGEYASALDRVERLINSNDEETLEFIGPILEKVETYLASSNTLSVDVELEEDTHFHKLARHQFAFANVEGELDSVEVRCDGKREKYTVAEEHIWSIPESWGQCTVLIKGEKNTKFNLLEMNNA